MRPHLSKLNKFPTASNYNIAKGASQELQDKLHQYQISKEKTAVSCLKENRKVFFSYLAEKRKVRNTISCLVDSMGQSTNDPTKMANLLGTFFESTFVDEPVENLPFIEPLQGNNDIDDLIIDTETVRLALESLNISKSQGPDGVHPKLLKSLSQCPSFVHALTRLFQACYDNGVFPEDWRSAIITAMYKKGDKLDPKNYRPISITCILAKCFERIIRDHVLSHVEKHIANGQHGFRNGRSCLSNLLDCMYRAYSLIDEDSEVDLIYLDFMKAFDSVPHKRLSLKLKRYGITGKILVILEAFLAGRKFVVKIGDFKSNSFRVKSGVPQGTILGPLLFILYINDLPDGLNCFASLFADDLKILVAASDRIKAQEDLDYLTKWQETWLLEFNTVDNKCKVLHAGKVNKGYKYELNSTLLPVTEEEKDLGVTVTKDLHWGTHIQKCIGKANSMTGWVTRNLIRKDIQTMMTVYKTIVRPHLEFCVQLWNPAPKHGHWQLIMDIENVQRKFTKRIQGIGLNPYRERLKKCQITTLIERRARGDLIECFKIWKGIVDYGSNMINVSRSGYNLILRSCKGEMLHSAFPNRIINYWNKIPEFVKDAKTTERFKARLGEFKNRNISLEGHYWELSEEYLNRVESNQQNREGYVSYMTENPNVARRRFINV